MFACTPGDEAIPPTGCLCRRPEIHALTRRIQADLPRRSFVAGLAACLASPGQARAQPSPPRPIVLTNFRLFDGRGATLRNGLTLRIDGNRIGGLAAGNPPPPDGALVIDCGGRTLMPGLIDAHWHALFAALPLQAVMTADSAYIHVAATAEAGRTLLRGFTTIRDCGGPTFALKQAIDEGLVAGPRIYPSGAMITTTGGHGDMRALSDLPRQPGGPLSAVEQTRAAAIADSLGEVRLRVREQLMQGASQIKIVGGGGVSTPRSPLDMSTFGEDELRAATAVAADWNTYVTVHAYASHTIRRAVLAGARCIEHAHLMDEATAGLMAEREVWLSIQPFLSAEDAVPLTGPSRDRMLQVFGSTDQAYRLARSHGIRTAFGSDLLFSPALTARQGTMLTHLSNWYSNAEVLRMATSDNAALLALSGPRDPYAGKLGVVEQDALADLLLVDGDPLSDITLLADPNRSLALIMKDGAIVKNRLG